MQQLSRDEKILSLVPVARGIAAHYRTRGVFSIPSDDLVSTAMVGACKAVDRFDPAKNDSLSGYAYQIMHGEVLDYFRREDVLSRGQRKKVKAGLAEPVEVHSLLGHMDLIDKHAEVSTASIDVLKLLEAVQLSDRERIAVDMLFFQEDVPHTAIAVKLGVHPSRVSQIKRIILKKLCELVNK